MAQSVRGEGKKVACVRRGTEAPAEAETNGRRRRASDVSTSLRPGPLLKPMRREGGNVARPETDVCVETESLSADE